MHEELVNLILGKVMRIKLDIFESQTPYYILTEHNYNTLQEIKKLISELEELDSVADNQTNN
jgi:hypothetical protein